MDISECPHCGRSITVYECLDCGEEVLNLNMDYRNPPLDEEECLCEDCFKSSLEGLIEEHENLAKEYRFMLENGDDY